MTPHSDHFWLSLIVPFRNNNNWHFNINIRPYYMKMEQISIFYIQVFSSLFDNYIIYDDIN